MAGEFLVLEQGNVLGIHALPALSTPGAITAEPVLVMHLVNNSKPALDSLDTVSTNSGRAVLLDSLAPKVLDIDGMRKTMAKFFAGTPEGWLSYNIPDEHMHRITPELLSVMPVEIVRVVTQERDMRPYPGQYL